MAIISTNNPNLHRKLKVWVAQRSGKTIGKTVEEFIQFCLETGYGDLSEDEKEAAKKLINGIR